MTTLLGFGSYNSHLQQEHEVVGRDEHQGIRFRNLRYISAYLGEREWDES